MKSNCLVCGHPVKFTGQHWDHVGPLKPRHIPQPRKVDELIIRLEADEKILSEAMIENEKLKDVLEDIREYKEYLQNEFGIEKEEK